MEDRYFSKKSHIWGGMSRIKITLRPKKAVSTIREGETRSRNINLIVLDTHVIVNRAISRGLTKCDCDPKCAKVSPLRTKSHASFDPALDARNKRFTTMNLVF